MWPNARLSQGDVLETKQTQDKIFLTPFSILLITGTNSMTIAFY